MHLLSPPIEPDHLTVAVAKIVPVGLREVIQRVVAHIHASGGDLVQQRLPQVGTRAVDQGGLHFLALRQPVADARDEFQARGSAAHDDHVVERVRELRGRLAARRRLGGIAGCKLVGHETHPCGRAGPPSVR